MSIIFLADLAKRLFIGRVFRGRHVNLILEPTVVTLAIQTIMIIFPTVVSVRLSQKTNWTGTASFQNS